LFHKMFFYILRLILLIIFPFLIFFPIGAPHGAQRIFGNQDILIINIVAIIVCYFICINLIMQTEKIYTILFAGKHIITGFF
jgi:O-antigen/teichoic acid export membrane protein